MFVSSADRNLLLLIAPELRLAPLHALHDTSYIKSKITVVCPYRACVRPLRKVSGINLISGHNGLQLWLLSDKS